MSSDMSSNQFLEQFGLLGVELFLREDALGLELAQLLQRGHHVFGLDAHRSGRCCRRCLGCCTAALQALLQVLREHLPQRHTGAQAAPVPAAPAGVRPDEVMATLEKLGELKSKGILTQEEFDAKKAELLKKLV